MENAEVYDIISVSQGDIMETREYEAKLAETIAGVYMAKLRQSGYSTFASLNEAEILHQVYEITKSTVGEMISKIFREETVTYAPRCVLHPEEEREVIGLINQALNHWMLYDF